MGGAGTILGGCGTGGAGTNATEKGRLFQVTGDDHKTGDDHSNPDSAKKIKNPT